MRIGFDAKRAFYNRSGLGNYSRDIIRSLHQNFPVHEYYLYTPGTKNSITVTQAENIKICTPHVSGGKPGQSWWRTFALARRATKDKLDIYHGLSNELPKDINSTGIRTVVTIHDLIFMRYPEWYRPVDRVIYRNKFRYSSRIANRVIAVSQQTREDLVNFFGIEREKIHVIYQGCNESFAKRLNDTQKRQVRLKWNLPEHYLLYVGTIEKRKNLLNLIRAIHQHGIDMPLVVVGKPTKYMKDIRDYIEIHQLKNVFFLNEIPVEDLPGIYQMASMFIYPSVFEGFGIPILEALVSGIPVITSKNGCFHEVGGNSTLYIDPSDTEELGTELKRLLSDRALQNKMIADGLRHSEQFTNDTIARQVMDLYLDLLNE